MTVIVLEKASTSLRGQLTRWMLEVKTGVFVGSVSARVRDELWERICKARGLGGCILAYSAANEQGFLLRFHGDTRRSLIDNENIQLVRIRATPRSKGPPHAGGGEPLRPRCFIRI